jgi:ABC-type multidrug transport system fused ATPase/permease subunit
MSRICYYFSERLVQEALDRIRAQRKLTTVTVAHRLSTIVDSDQIAVIADGSIQELGTHKDLIKEGGIYALLCEGQGLTADAASNSTTKTKSPKVGAIETSIIKTGNEDDVEAGIVTKDDGDDGDDDDDDGVPDTSGVLSRLWQYNKAETGYTILGYAGGMIVGALPACEAILFGYITANYFLIGDPQEMRATNFSLSLWFLVLAAASFVANIAMGVGFVSSTTTKRYCVSIGSRPSFRYL